MVNQERENQISCFLSIELHATLPEFVVSFPNYAFWVVDCVIHGPAYHWLKEPDEEDDLFFWESDEEDEQARLIKGFNEFSFQIP